MSLYGHRYDDYDDINASSSHCKLTCRFMLHHMYIHVYTVHILVVLHFTALCILHCALLCELNDDDDDGLLLGGGIRHITATQAEVK